MPATELYRTGLDSDLRPLSALLWQRRIPHRIAEEGGEQVLRLAAAEQRPEAEALLRAWLNGELSVQLRRVRRRPSAPLLRAALAANPVTSILIALGVLGFLAVYVPAPVTWISALSFQPFSLAGGKLLFDTPRAEPWRLITPAFLHFGWLHIVFNALWCWELGRRIESRLGSANLLGLFLVIAAASNTAQAHFTPAALFGGLSGVVYGWLGFAWVAGRLNPRWGALVPATPVMLFMVGWLLFCLLGLVNVLGFSVANAAHVAGLLSGMLLGSGFALLHRGRS